MFNKAGIGTYTIPQIAKPMMAKLHKVLDSMVGIHLDAHVMGKYVPLRHHFPLSFTIPIPDGYVFLMQNCEWVHP